MKEHLIIIGGVAAGTKAASKARRENPDLKISLYTLENYVSYSACGLPYYIQDMVQKEKDLIVRTPEEFREKENIGIFLNHEVTKIEPQKNSVIIKNLDTDEEFSDNYTHLLIATGSKSIIPPIEGTGLKNVFKLKSITDGIEIKEAVKSAKKAVIIGGGYIGLELAESFHSRGLETTVIEMAPQILSTVDPDLGAKINSYLQEQGVEVIISEQVTALKGDDAGNVTRVNTQDGKSIEADIVVIAVGVKPNTDIAKKAGIELGKKGAIKVNKRMQTNIPNIYAAGDCVESINRITGRPVWVPLGSTANKQGRTAAINITGGDAKFEGILASAVTKIFDYTASRSGVGEKEAKELGIDYEMAIVTHRDKSGYMPDAEEIVIKLFAENKTEKIIGIQAVGKGDVDKRVNIIATAMTLDMTVSKFLETDLSYAPPYSPSIDPLLVAAQILQDKISREISSISPQELQKYIKEKVPCHIIDIRSSEEFEDWHINEAKNIPSEQLEQNIQDGGSENIVVCCDEGMKSYIESLRLKAKGCKNIRFLDGGMNYLKDLPEYND